ncbi:unnamed protein product [Leuciscus chuanchicus]
MFSHAHRDQAACCTGTYSGLERPSMPFDGVTSYSEAGRPWASLKETGNIIQLPPSDPRPTTNHVIHSSVAKEKEWAQNVPVTCCRWDRLRSNSEEFSSTGPSQAVAAGVAGRHALKAPQLREQHVPQAIGLPPGAPREKWRKLQAYSCSLHSGPPLLAPQQKQSGMKADMLVE